MVGYNRSFFTGYDLSYAQLGDYVDSLWDGHLYSELYLLSVVYDLLILQEKHK